MEAHNAVRFTIMQKESQEGCGSHSKSGTWNTIAGNILELISGGITPYLMCTVTGKNYDRLSGLFEFSTSNRVGVRLSMVRDSVSHLKPGLMGRILYELSALYDRFGETMPTDLPIQRYAGFGDWNPATKKKRFAAPAGHTLQSTTAATSPAARWA